MSSAWLIIPGTVLLLLAAILTIRWVGRGATANDYDDPRKDTL